jgi:hypothetical protein
MGALPLDLILMRQRLRLLQRTRAVGRGRGSAERIIHGVSTVLRPNLLILLLLKPPIVEEGLESYLELINQALVNK